jgi:hypothetical protein
MTLAGLNSMSPVITTVFIIIQMGPFAILFLNLINFWSLSSLYTMLSINVPSYLSAAHKIIFDSIQTTLLSLLGINITLPYLNSKQVPK